MKEKGLGGAMWWESSADRRPGLIAAVAEAFGGGLEKSTNLLEFPVSKFDNARRQFA